VLRILAEHPVKPWQYRSWISLRDPDFEAKAAVILDLYQGFYQGKRLRPGDRILSVDECVRYFVRGIFPCPVPDAYPVFLNRAIWSSSARFTRGLCRTGLTVPCQGGCCVSWSSSRLLAKPAPSPCRFRPPDGITVP